MQLYSCTGCFVPLSHRHKVRVQPPATTTGHGRKLEAAPHMQLHCMHSTKLAKRDARFHVSSNLAHAAVHQHSPRPYTEPPNLQEASNNKYIRFQISHTNLCHAPVMSLPHRSASLPSQWRLHVTQLALPAPRAAASTSSKQAHPGTMTASSPSMPFPTNKAYYLVILPEKPHTL